MDKIFDSGWKLLFQILLILAFVMSLAIGSFVLSDSLAVLLNRNGSQILNISTFWAVIRVIVGLGFIITIYLWTDLKVSFSGMILALVLFLLLVILRGEPGGIFNINENIFYLDSELFSWIIFVFVVAKIAKEFATELAIRKIIREGASKGVGKRI